MVKTRKIVVLNEGIGIYPGKVLEPRGRVIEQLFLNTLNRARNEQVIRVFRWSR